eukprot:Hpha_TRINITY_DN24744_c0_g1::TRINITY_DN24744_c0_g1_i1::g.110266::m.110266
MSASPTPVSASLNPLPEGCTAVLSVIADAGRHQWNTKRLHNIQSVSDLNRKREEACKLREQLRGERYLLHREALKRNFAASRPLPQPPGLDAQRERQAERRELARRQRFMEETQKGRMEVQALRRRKAEKQRARALAVATQSGLVERARCYDDCVIGEVERRRDIVWGEQATRIGIEKLMQRTGREVEGKVLIWRKRVRTRVLKRRRAENVSRKAAQAAMCAEDLFSASVEREWDRLAAAERDLLESQARLRDELEGSEHWLRWQITGALQEGAEGMIRRWWFAAEAEERTYICGKEEAERLDGRNRVDYPIALALVRRRKLDDVRGRRDSIYRIRARPASAGAGQQAPAPAGRPASAGLLPSRRVSTLAMPTAAWHVQEARRLEKLQRQEGYSLDREVTIARANRAALRIALHE